MPVPSQHSFKMLKKARLFTRPPRGCQDSLFAQGRTLPQPRPQRVAQNGSSKLACVPCPQDGPDESLTARDFLTRPPTGTPRRAMSPGEGLPILYFSLPLFRGVAEAALYCAHRATTVSSWGLCEQEGHLAAPRYPSETARCASTEDSPGHPSPAGGLFQHPVSGRDGPL
jgi:hypothetical protein